MFRVPRIYSRESFAATTTNTSSSSSSRKGTNEKFTTDTDTDQESLSASFRGQLEAGALSSSMKTSDRHPGTGSSGVAKKVKRVQFQDGTSDASNSWAIHSFPSLHSFQDYRQELVPHRHHPLHCQTARVAQ